MKLFNQRTPASPVYHDIESYTPLADGEHKHAPLGRSWLRNHPPTAPAREAAAEYVELESVVCHSDASTGHPSAWDSYDASSTRTSSRSLVTAPSVSEPAKPYFSGGLAAAAVGFARRAVTGQLPSHAQLLDEHQQVLRALEEGKGDGVAHTHPPHSLVRDESSSTSAS